MPASVPHVLSAVVVGEVRTPEQAHGTASNRKIEVEQHVDGSATIRVHSAIGDGEALVTVDIPAPAGDEVIRAFGGSTA